MDYHQLLLFQICFLQQVYQITVTIPCDYDGLKDQSRRVQQVQIQEMQLLMNSCNEVGQDIPDLRKISSSAFRYPISINFLLFFLVIIFLLFSWLYYKEWPQKHLGILTYLGPTPRPPEEPEQKNSRPPLYIRLYKRLAHYWAPSPKGKQACQKVCLY